MKKTECLWRNITSELASKIISGSFKQGERFISADEIARQFDASNITGRRVLAELAGMGLIEKGRGRGCKVRRALKNADVFFLLEPGRESVDALQSSYIYAQIYKGMAEAALEMNIMLRPVTYAAFVAADFPSSACGHVVLIQNPPYDAAVRHAVAKGVGVCAGALEPQKDMSTIRCDLKAGALFAVSHLIERGHRRIAFLAPDKGPWFMSRFDGYCEALRRAGIDVRFSLLKEADPYTYESNAEALGQLLALPDPPTAIFCATDMHAAFALEFCRVKNVRVPQDLAVVGFDNRPEAALSTPPLTTIDTVWERQGREALRLLREKIDSRNTMVRDIQLKPKLVVRRST